MLELIARVGNTAAGILLIALLLPVLAIDRTRLAISRWRLRRFLRKRERDDRKNGVCRTIADGSWSDPATWSGGRVPVHGNAVYLGHSVYLDEHTMNCSLGTVSFIPKITADPVPAPIPDPHEHELHRFEDDGGPPTDVAECWGEIRSNLVRESESSASGHLIGTGFVESPFGNPIATGPKFTMRNCTFSWNGSQPQPAESIEFKHNGAAESPLTIFSPIDGASSDVKAQSFGLTRAVPYDSEEIEASGETEPPNG